MNIFCTHYSPKISAYNLDDKRVIKMILESTQMLNIIRDKLNLETIGYKTKGHRNHPCTIWAGESYQNYIWLYDHMIYLQEEYTKRYNKHHKCEEYNKILLKDIDRSPELFKKDELTNFANCSLYKNEEDVIIAYRKTMLDKWENDKRIPTWYRKNVTKEQQRSLIFKDG